MIQERICIAVLLGSICMVGCGGLSPKLDTAGDLAQALKDGGVAWETSSGISFGSMRYAKIDEGIALEGDGVRVDILRITDHRTYNIMSSAAALMGIMGDELDESAVQPPEIYRSEPFVIVIRNEPQSGQVASVLENILPRDEE
jgi:hypothetical protein